MIDNTTRPLFDTPSHPLSLTEALARSKPKPADKAQRRFQKLVTKIERLREQLTQWENYTHRYNQRVTGELQPLQEELRASRKQMALLIDELLSVPTRGRRLSKAQRSKLTYMLTQLVEDLLQEADDDEVRALQDKYQAQEDEDDELLQTDITRQILSEMTGLDIDAGRDARTPEELIEHAQRIMDEAKDDDPRRSARPEKSENEAATKPISPSLRDVFRKLVSALHPDREPDATERERKNELMQRVNRAYEANDLLTLLGLQLEIEQIDAAHLASLSAERLEQYSQILREQQAELEAELERAAQHFLLIMGRRRINGLTPAHVDRELTADIAQMRMTLRYLQEDLVAFRDPDRLRASLANFEPELRDQVDDAEFLAAFMEGIQGAGRRRRRRSREPHR